MTINKKSFIAGFPLLICLFTSLASAHPIVGNTYGLYGSIDLLNISQAKEVPVLLEGSNYTFSADGIFRANLITALGATSIEMGYDIDSIGKGDIRLRPSAIPFIQPIIDHIETSDRYRADLDTNMDGINTALDILLYVNDINADKTSDTYKQVGQFFPNAANGSFGDYTFVAVAMDGIFSVDGTFTLFNGQFNEAGQLLGNTVWSLSSGKFEGPHGSEIPEPTSMLLLGAGVAGLMRKRRVGSERPLA